MYMIKDILLYMVRGREKAFSQFCLRASSCDPFYTEICIENMYCIYFGIKLRDKVYIKSL